jgi:hypothetical protein
MESLKMDPSRDEIIAQIMKLNGDIKAIQEEIEEIWSEIGDVKVPKQHGGGRGYNRTLIPSYKYRR